MQFQHSSWLSFLNQAALNWKVRSVDECRLSITTIASRLVSLSIISNTRRTNLISNANNSKLNNSFDKQVDLHLPRSIRTTTSTTTARDGQVAGVSATAKPWQSHRIYDVGLRSDTGMAALIFDVSLHEILCTCAMRQGDLFWRRVSTNLCRALRSVETSQICFQQILATTQFRPRRHLKQRSTAISLVSEYHHHPSERHVSTHQGISLGHKTVHVHRSEKHLMELIQFGAKKNTYFLLQLKAISCSAAWSPQISRRRGSPLLLGLNLAVNVRFFLP